MSLIPAAYAEAFLCPSCSSQRLVSTKEKIIVCQDCLTGYRVLNGIPDFRLEKAISFKKKQGGGQTKPFLASVTVIMGDDKNQQCDVPFGHCVVFGRKVLPSLGQDVASDVTVVIKPKAQNTFSQIDPGNHELIEKYLSRQGSEKKPESDLFSAQKKSLGDYVRLSDFLLGDPSISRTHAVIYHNEQGLNILDLYSKNGTYVNGYEVESCKLRQNDVISLGTVSCRINLY